MRNLVLATTVKEVYANQGLDPETDLRSSSFYRAVIQELAARKLIDVDTDGIDVTVTVEPWE